MLIHAETRFVKTHVVFMSFLNMEGNEGSLIAHGAILIQLPQHMTPNRGLHESSDASLCLWVVAFLSLVVPYDYVSKRLHCSATASVGSWFFGFPGKARRTMTINCIVTASTKTYIFILSRTLSGSMGLQIQNGATRTPKS